MARSQIMLLLMAGSASSRQPRYSHPWLTLHRSPNPRIADTRRSALGFVVYTCLFLPWMLLYLIGGEGCQAGLLASTAYSIVLASAICIDTAHMLRVISSRWPSVCLLVGCLPACQTALTCLHADLPEPDAAGEKVLGTSAYNKLDINSLDLSGSGLGAG